MAEIFIAQQVKGGILMVDADMYQGPIQLIYSEAQQQIEESVLTEVQKVGVVVDKNELLKALAYDRGQYEKGRADALASIVRCKDCKYAPLNLGEKCDPAKIKWPDASYFADPDDECCPYSCGDQWYSIMPQPDWYCWKGERRDTDANGT